MFFSTLVMVTLLPLKNTKTYRCVENVSCGTKPISVRTETHDWSTYPPSIKKDFTGSSSGKLFVFFTGVSLGVGSLFLKCFAQR